MSVKMYKTRIIYGSSSSNVCSFNSNSIKPEQEVLLEYLRVQSVYIHHAINMYYNTAGIITIFLHYDQYMIFMMWIIYINTHKLS